MMTTFFQRSDGPNHETEGLRLFIRSCRRTPDTGGKTAGSNRSAIVDAALDRYLNPERETSGDGALMRRLDRLSRQLDRLDRDSSIMAETIALFVRYYLTITPPLPSGDQEAARALGREALRDICRSGRQARRLRRAAGCRCHGPRERVQSRSVRAPCGGGGTARLFNARKRNPVGPDDGRGAGAFPGRTGGGRQCLISSRPRSFAIDVALHFKRPFFAVLAPSERLGHIPGLAADLDAPVSGCQLCEGRHACALRLSCALCVHREVKTRTNVCNFV